MRQGKQRNVCFWHKTDIMTLLGDARFQVKGGHPSLN
jgi:hypothetical protein